MFTLGKNTPSETLKQIGELYAIGAEISSNPGEERPTVRKANRSDEFVPRNVDEAFK